MKFEWDEAKRLENIRKHGIDFVEVVSVFDSQTVIFEDNRSYQEERFMLLGILKIHVIAVIYVYRGEQIIRLISARKATKYEQKIYFSSI